MHAPSARRLTLLCGSIPPQAGQNRREWLRDAPDRNNGVLGGDDTVSESIRLDVGAARGQDRTP